MTEAIALHDDTFEIDFDRVFNDYIAANQKKWAHDRSTTLGASEAFSCLRKAFFDKRGSQFGYEPDADWEEDWGAITRGNLIENYHVVPAVRDHMPTGVEMLYTGDDQETLVVGRTSATPDGLITGLPKGCKLSVKGGMQDIVIDDIITDCVVFEIKSIDPRANLVEERQKHHDQTQIQLALFHAKTKWRPYYSIVLYVDASFLSRMTPFVVKYDGKALDEATQRADQIWSATNAADLEPEGRFANECKYCKWKKACGTSTVSSIPTYDDDETATPETIQALDTLVRKAMVAKDLAADAASDVEKANNAIKEFLKTRNTRKMKGPTWSVTWYGQDGKISYDTKAMKADGIDMEKYEKEGAPFDVLRITPRIEGSDKPKKAKAKK